LYPTYLHKISEHRIIKIGDQNVLYILPGNFAVMDVKTTFYCSGQSLILAFFRPGMFLVTFMILHNRNTVSIGDHRSDWVLAIQKEKFVRRFSAVFITLYKRTLPVIAFRTYFSIETKPLKLSASASYPISSESIDLAS